MIYTTLDFRFLLHLFSCP